MKALRRATGETFASLRVRNFRLFFTGQLISQVGNWLTLVAQTLLVLKLTDSGVALGALAAAQFGPVLVLGPWAGTGRRPLRQASPAADRADDRHAAVVRAGRARVQRPPAGVAIYGVAFVGGVTIAFDNPARRAFVVEMVPEEDITTPSA